MKTVIEHAESQLIAKEHALINEVKSAFASIMLPQKDIVPTQTLTPQSSPKTAYVSLGGGLALMVAGISMNSGKTIPILLGLGAMCYGAARLFNTNTKGQQMSPPVSQNKDVSSIISKVNELYSTIMNKWDDGLKEIKDITVGEIDALSPDATYRSKAMDILRARSVIEISTFDLLRELNAVKSDANALQHYLSQTQATFIDAIESAYQKQVITYNNLLNV